MGTQTGTGTGPVTQYVMPPDDDPGVPRWDEKYARSPAGLKAGPVISDALCPLIRRNGEIL